MVDRKFQKSNVDRCRGQNLSFDFGISLKMVARKTHNSKFGRGRILNFGINLKNGRSHNSKFKKSTAAAVEI